MLKRIQNIVLASALSVTSVVAGAAPIAVASNATTVSAAFQFGWGGSFGSTGTLTGSDLNADGILTTNELTSIYESANGHLLSSLSDIGDINIAARTWTPNGQSWGWAPDLAYMTFDSRAWSCSAYNGCAAAFTSFEVTGGAAVPEPASLALFGLAFAALGASRRRKA
jgi:hypothetical protein